MDVYQDESNKNYNEINQSGKSHASRERGGC